MSENMASAKQKRATELLEGNERSYRELVSASHGQFKMNASDLRREMFIDHLVEIGVVTDEQRWDFEIKFNENIEENLEKNWASFRESQEKAKAAEKAASKAASLTVVKNPEKKLIVPGGK